MYVWVALKKKKKKKKKCNVRTGKCSKSRIGNFRLSKLNQWSRRQNINKMIKTFHQNSKRKRYLLLKYGRLGWVKKYKKNQSNLRTVKCNKSQIGNFKFSNLNNWPRRKKKLLKWSTRFNCQLSKILKCVFLKDINMFVHKKWFGPRSTLHSWQYKKKKMRRPLEKRY